MTKLCSILLLALSLQVSAQRAVRMPDPLESLTRQQKNVLNNQANDFYSAATPAVTQAAKSTVTLSYRGIMVSYGTVVKSPITGKNVILTKWSEIAHKYKRLLVTTSSGKYHQASLIGIYPEHDLAMLETELKLTPLNLQLNHSPRLGEFIALAGPQGQVLSLGVISVQERSLRESDKAYLGVLMDFDQSTPLGTPLERVVPESPAAAAGLRQGDIVTAIDQKPIKGALEMRNTLQKLIPGSEVHVSYRRGKSEKNTRVRLGSRPRELDPRRIPQKRMNEMQQMGAVPNRVRQDFPNVIQSDLPIQPDETPENPSDNYTNECGGPVVDLNGRTVGIVIARGSRIKTFIIPTSTIQQLLSQPPSVLKNTRYEDLSAANSRTTRHSLNGRDLQPGPNSLRKLPPRAIPLNE